MLVNFFPFNKEPVEVPNIDRDIAPLTTLVNGIMSGLGALVYRGQTYQPRMFLGLATSIKQQNGKATAGMVFNYQEEIDKENFLEPCPYNKNLLIPTVERAIVDHQRYTAVVDENEELTQAIEFYEHWHKGDFSKLLEVADFYGRRKEIEKAIEVAKQYY